MLWAEIRRDYPNQWLVVEAIEAYTTTDNRRQLKKLAVDERGLALYAGTGRYGSAGPFFVRREAKAALFAGRMG